MNPLILWIAIFGASLLLAPSAAADQRSLNAVEVLGGEPAVSHRPTNEVTVMRSTALARWDAKAQKPFAFANSETIQDSSGEVTFWSWDDGVDGTWEGSIYMADYANGLEGVADAQIFFDTPDFFRTSKQDVYGGGADRPAAVRASCTIGMVSRPLVEA